MDTFPYESWDEAMAAARDLDEAYYTFGEGGAIPLLILAMIATAVAFVMWIQREKDHLETAAVNLRETLTDELRGEL